MLKLWVRAVMKTQFACRWPATQSETPQPKEEYFPRSVHIKSEVSISEDVYPMCPHCFKSMMSNGELATHLMSTHSNLAYHCDKCDQIFFGSKKQFIIHVRHHASSYKNETILQQPILNLKMLGRKNFSCSVCGKCFSRRFDMHRHQKIHTINSICQESKNESFVCVLCGKLFAEKDIMQHLQSVHGSCLETEKTYIRKTHQNGSIPVKDILYDMKNTSSNLCSTNQSSRSVYDPKSDKKGLFLCDVCNKTYTRKYDMLKHWKKHSEEEVAKVENETVLVDDDGDSSYLFRHTKISENNDHRIVADLDKVSRSKVTVGQMSLYRCNYCSKHFHSRYLFVRHLRIHTGEKPFTCHICGKQFRVAVQLSRHVRDVHEGIKNYPCDICGRRFANSHSRNDHRRIHTGERPCVCHLCGKAFKTKASLFVHTKFHVDVFPHKCPHCDQGFRMRQQLNVHILLHTGEKPHTCQFCKKSFRLSKTLKDHILIHTNNETYECSECGKHFSQERYLKNHVRAHKKSCFTTRDMIPD
ncbi:hypothetical protein PR048_015953 [Dryococelus australis]|uniref:C2H2-type domain-containing protein n=1 Tax=Dryococelus australis TaxID=614101 RepID=A0ABQ9HID1_9NEOP|nr:hypothetical protein PR048_015953 [Dryococelus australis]